MIREAKRTDLQSILELYLHLHETSIPEDSEHLRDTWEQIIKDPHHHIVIYEVDGKILSSCVCVIIPNLSKQVRPYALIENVVTHSNYRKKGYATACLNFAKDIAVRENCYKIMLLTGSKDPKTLNFYQQAGYNVNDKTAFVQWL